MMKDPIQKPTGKKFEDLVEGDKDPITDTTIKSLVLKGEGFIVYLDDEHGICWSTDEDYSDFADDFGLVSNHVTTLEGITTKLFKGDELKNFNYLLAQGFARVLDDKDSTNANKMLEGVEKTIHENGRQLLKMSYITASFMTTICVGLFITLTWIFRLEVLEIIGQSALEVLLAVFCGGIGAFISSFIRSLNFDGDVRVPRNTYRLDGFLRIFYGLIAGFVMSLAIKSNVVLGLINDLDQKSLAVVCFFSTIAGASESLIPSIIKKVEEKV
jgi:hypothetical protein